MSMLRKFSVILAVMGIFSLSIVPAFAQAQRTVTVTITEADINDAFRITNPVRVTISNKSVDLQPGQVVVKATYTPRRPTTGMTAYDIETTLVPTVSNGRVTWSATSVVINGTAVTDLQLTQANNAIVSAWRRFQSTRIGTQRVTDLTITDTDMTYTVVRGA